MESVRSAFHAQLATVMDSLLAAAVCEIAKIFEGTLCEQQAELAQKSQEICVLRDKLERRRQRTKSGGGEAGESPSGEVEDGVRHQSLAVTGPAMGKDASSHQDGIQGLSQSLGGLKEEITGQDGSLVKHERAGPCPILGSAAVQSAEGALAAGDQRQMTSLSVTQNKAKVPQWGQDHRAGHEQLHDGTSTSTSFLSISQTGRCSPNPDQGLHQPGQWTLEETRQKTLSPDESSCPGATRSSACTDAPCFRPGFGSDQTSNDDGHTNSFPFLDQEPENQNTNHNSVSGPVQNIGQTEAQQELSQTGDSSWRLRDDRGGGRVAPNNTRRVATLGVRDPLRTQSNSQLVTLRHANGPAPVGGNGRPYTCPYCTKCFTYPSHQRRHLLRHTGVRLHPCQFCDKSFLTPSELTVHTRTHTGERPFGCAQCGKRFARSGNLRAHQRDVHMGKRPFACAECGKRFAHRGNLRVHNHRVHQGDPYYMEDQQEADIGPNPV